MPSLKLPLPLGFAPSAEFFPGLHRGTNMSSIWHCAPVNRIVHHHRYPRCHSSAGTAILSGADATPARNEEIKPRLAMQSHVNTVSTYKQFNCHFRFHYSSNGYYIAWWFSIHCKIVHIGM